MESCDPNLIDSVESRTFERRFACVDSNGYYADERSSEQVERVRRSGDCIIEPFVEEAESTSKGGGSRAQVRPAND